MPVAREHITENGLLIQHMTDGSTIRKCLTDQCIRETTNGDEREKCGCEDCSTKRLEKTDRKETLTPDEFEELQRELPRDLLEDLMEFIEVDDAGVGEVPEDDEELGKALMKDLYGPEPETDEATEAILTKSEGQHSRLATPEHFAEAIIESETVDFEKSADAPDSLDRFYAEVES